MNRFVAMVAITLGFVSAVVVQGEKAYLRGLEEAEEKLVSGSSSFDSISDGDAMADLDPDSPLGQLRIAADKIEMRFKKSEMDPGFADKIDKQDRDEMVKDSTEFWDDIRHMSKKDASSLTSDDAKALQTAVTEVAQLDDDMDNPKREQFAVPEFQDIKKQYAAEFGEEA